MKLHLTLENEEGVSTTKILDVSYDKVRPDLNIIVDEMKEILETNINNL